MTMLDRMRRHKGWLKWSLALVVLAFVVFYIPDFLQQSTGAAPSDAVARVDGRPIRASEYQRAYFSQMEAFRRAYGSQINDQMIRQLGIDQQILRTMIDEQVALVEAERLGLVVSDAEVAQRVYAIPAFQQNGAFGGKDYYAQVLRSQRPALTPSEFEASLRKSLVVDKLRSALTAWVTISNAEVDDEYRRRNEKVKLELVVFAADKLRGQVTVTDADLASHFEARKADYRIGERRKIRYLLIDLDAIRSKTTVPPSDVERYYRQNQEQYTTPEQVRASHILLKTEGKDEAAVRAAAEALLKQVRAGADFAALATKHSQDEASAKLGGDLDYFGRGRMVPEFEQAVFALKPGETSDLVKTQYGFHIIRLVDRKAEATRPLDEVRQQITDQLVTERAQTQATALADTLAGELKKPGDLDKVAKARGLTVTESAFFAREDTIPGLGPSPQLASEVFEVKADTVGGPVRVARGQVFFAVSGTEASRLPKLDEVKDRVREDVVRQKARDLAKTRAEALAADLAQDFTGGAKRAGLEVKTTELVVRGSALPEIGISQAVDAAVFAAAPGTVTAPIAADTGVVIARVVGRQDVSPTELSAARDGLRNELLNERRGRFYSAYMQKARERMNVEVYQETVRSIAG